MVSPGLVTVSCLWSGCTKSRTPSVRVDQANTLKADPAARHVIKRSRWLLLSNRDNLSDEHAITLDELLAANASLATRSTSSKRNSKNFGMRLMKPRPTVDGWTGNG